MERLNITVNKKYILLTCCAFLFVTTSLWAAPVISKINGHVSHGASITISGSGFGIKSPAAPLLWETFEEGTAGQLLSTDSDWETQIEGTARYNGGIPSQIFSNDLGYGQGNQSAKQVLVSNKSCWARTRLGVLGDQSQLFVSYHFYEPSGGSGDHVKMGRIGSQDNVHSWPDAGYTAYLTSDTSNGYYYVFADSTTEHVLARSIPNITDSWTREDMWVKLSTDGSADGEVGVWRNCSTTYFSRAVNTKNSASNYTAYNQWFMPYYSEGGTRTFYIDDVYIDNTLSRVEIGNSPTWSNCTHREIQIPATWANSIISVTVNRGSYRESDDAWLYVIDSAGNANVNGFKIRFSAEGGDIIPPASPVGIEAEIKTDF